ncbi:MAG: nitroreductase family protein, partial [Clostridia bacterium]|nr:nitroreductase family protein [Clostridia bacterium]
ASATQAMGFNKHTSKAGAFIVIEERPATLREGIAKKVGSRAWAENDVGISASYITLAATDEGLGTCMIGLFDKNAVISAVGADKKANIRLVIAVGYPAEDDVIRTKQRKPMEETVVFVE